MDTHGSSRLGEWSKVALRFLLIIPIFGAGFVAFRQCTIRYGQEDVTQYVAAHPEHGTANAKYFLPFILECSALGWGEDAKTAITNRWYYLWVFGFVCELPIQRQQVDAVTSERTFSDIADERLLNRGY